MNTAETSPLAPDPSRLDELRAEYAALEADDPRRTELFGLLLDRVDELEEEAAWAQLDARNRATWSARRLLLGRR